MLRQFALAEVAAVGVERNDLVGPGAGAEPACRLDALVARMADIDRRLRLAAAHRDLHQHRLDAVIARSEEHTSELRSLMRISYAVFCLKKKKPNTSFSNTSLLYIA